MIRRVAHGKALPPEVVEQIVAKTDGVPLFVEELTKMVLESGLLQEREERYALTGPLPPLAIPATLHDSLMARLDRLATVKGLAQLGATLGREFAYALLQAVSPWDEATLQRGLHQLVEAEFLYQRGLPPQATYLFKHALIQDAAYQSLLRSTRQQYHQRIAQVLEAQFPETCRDPARAAGASLYRGGPHGAGHPLLAAGRPAGPPALGQSGSDQHLTTGLELLATLPETPARAQQELDLQTRPGAGVDGHQGLCGPGGGADLCPGAGVVPAGRRDPAALPGAAGAYGGFICNRAELADGAGAGGTALSPGAARRTTRRSSWRPTTCSGTTLFYLGECAARPDPPRAGHCALSTRSSTVPWRSAMARTRGACLAYAAWTLWCLGYPEQALRRSRRRWPWPRSWPTP